MWFGSLFASADKPSRRRANRHAADRRLAARRLLLEPLEDRVVLTFAAPTIYPVGPSSYSLTAADFTGDGILNLATNGGVLAGNGDGSFQPRLSPVPDDELRVSIDSHPDYWTVYFTEGNTGTTNAKFTVRLSAPYDLPVSVNLSVVEGDTDYWVGDSYWGFAVYPPATLNTDFEGGSQTITFNPGELTKEITVPVIGDREGEPDEYFFVNLNSTDYGTIVSPQAVGIIDDDEPIASINSVAALEGAGTMTFTISLSNPSTDIVEVTYATADTGGYRSATAGSDYVAQVGTVTFDPGELSKTITVEIIDDRLGENDDEYFFVNLTGATGAVLDYPPTGTGFIQDNEPRIFMNNVSLTEGNSGTKLMTFTVTLSAAYDQPVTVNYATQDGSAVAGSDYVATAGMLTFAPGQTSKTITVAIKGDKTKENDEYFYVLLSEASDNARIHHSFGSGTILNDEGGKGPGR